MPAARLPLAPHLRRLVRLTRATSRLRPATGRKTSAVLGATSAEKRRARSAGRVSPSGHSPHRLPIRSGCSTRQRRAAWRPPPTCRSSSQVRASNPSCQHRANSASAAAASNISRGSEWAAIRCRRKWSAAMWFRTVLTNCRNWPRPGSNRWKSPRTNRSANSWARSSATCGSPVATRRNVNTARLYRPSTAALRRTGRRPNAVGCYNLVPMGGQAIQMLFGPRVGQWHATFRVR